MALITRDTNEIINCLRKAGIQEDQIKTAMLALNDVQKNPITVYESFGRLSNSLIQWLGYSGSNIDYCADYKILMQGVFTPQQWLKFYTAWVVLIVSR